MIYEVNAFHITGSWHDDVIEGKHFRVTGPLWGECTGHWCKGISKFDIYYVKPDEFSPRTFKVKMMAWFSVDIMMVSEPMMTDCQRDPGKNIQWN